jgi:hypothetical protein
MIPVVGDLVIELGGRRMEAQQPFQSPARLVEHIRHAVRPRPTASVDPIRKTNRPEAVGEEHLSGGVPGGELVLEQVGGIVPTAAHIEVAASRPRSVGRATVELMTSGVEPGIVAAALLPQELEQQVRPRPIHVAP